MKEKKIEKCCGECCWFYGEMTDGEGLCAHNPMFDLFSNRCNSPACMDFVSRQEMRHHMAVIAKRFRSLDNPRENYNPFLHDEKMALKFAYKYMKVFSKL